MQLKNKLKITALISLGSALEFYDFTIYGLFAAYLGSNFFPKEVGHSSFNFINILLVFGTGYIARPLGGLLFGNLGDRQGRKFSFRITLTIMALATCAVGLIPSYSKIGILSPCLLLLLRIIQGLSMGAELPISSVFIFEQVSLGKNIFYGATLFGLSNVGLLLGNCFNFGLINTLSIDQISDFGWRIPFVFGGILGVVAIYLRAKLHETAVFKSMKIVKTPWKTVFSQYKNNVFTSVLLSLSYGLCVNFGFVLLFSILEQLFHLPNKTLALLTLVSTILFCVLDSIIGLVADYFKIKPLRLIMLGVLQFSMSYYLVLYGYSLQNYLLGFAAMMWLTFATSFFDSTIPNVLPKLFPAEVRSTGVATSYSIGLGLSGVFISIASILVIAKEMTMWVLPLAILIIHLITLLVAYRSKLLVK